jgi:hypothetical protein
MTVSNFDGLTFGSGSGGLAATSVQNSGDPNLFSGALSDGAGLTGSASGAFTLDTTNPLPTPNGVMGAFDVNGTVGADAYSATGNFLGSQ